ncbi:MAG: HsdR family type I site-specific deoxyribonuclease [Cyanobacteria bacterium P01_C01_bin.72]
MGEVGGLERVTQNRVVKLFQHRLEYRYLGHWQDRKNNSNIEADILGQYLAGKGYSETLINKAIAKLKKTATDQTKSLYDINQEVYGLLRYGVKVKENVGENNQTVWLIDWENPLENDFAIAEEVAVEGDDNGNKRPDIVIYINGIALGVIELKRSKVFVSEGIRQNLDNQKPEFIKPFFHTMQLVMAGNDTEGLRYGTIETPEKYYLTWKEDPDFGQPIDSDEVLDKALLELLNKERLIELIHDFIVFDLGTKKVCRSHQYFGVKATQQRLSGNEGGIIWHTQGSGKSLTMVWLAKWIKENIDDSRVLIITDRDELDEQIEGIFLGVKENIYRTSSGKDLIAQLNDSTPWLICSLIHKFGKKKNKQAEDSDYEKYLDELQNSLPANFQAKGNIYVFVDECHRTQSGKLHQAMKRILPDAILIGFTGTPLLKKDKDTTIKVFGEYIHTYKFNEAVKDKVVLDLRYEARNIEQNLTSPQKIDQWFDAKTSGLTELAKNQLKKRWGTMRQVLSSQDRLNKIVADIIFDMGVKDRLKSGRGNALLVSGSIYQACKYYELFQNQGFTKCAIITSYKPAKSDIKGEATGEGYTEKLRQYEIYNKMLGKKDPEVFESEVKKKFTEQPGQMKLLIVVDKLLTGFDAPATTYLYIDKTMRDHGLFQAICRVNRLDGEDKEYGYIIDYKDLFKSLEKSVSDYTTDVLDGYDKDDVEGLLSDRLEKGRERLEESIEAVKALCEPVAPPQDTPAYLKYFCGSPEDKAEQRGLGGFPHERLFQEEELSPNQPKRLSLYKNVASLIRAYANLANEMVEAGYTPDETAKIKQEVKHYENVRHEVKIASGDYIDLKVYEPAMRHLIDTYIRAEESEKISAFDDLTLVQLIVENGINAIDRLPHSIRQNRTAVAETINNNLRTVITEERPTNPQYFDRMSVLLDELIQQRREQAIEYEEYLQKIAQLCQQVTHPEGSGDYPASLNTSAKRALYDNLDRNEVKAIALDHAIRTTKKDNWKGSRLKEREVKYTIKKHLSEDEEVDKTFEIVKEQSDYQ